VPQHVARPVTGFVVDYSVHRNFLLRPHWLYFSHAVRRDYLSRGNTGSTSIKNGSHAPNNWSESTLTSELQQQLLWLHHRPPWLQQQTTQAATAKSFI
jgi:hypothetical protein